jgi:hypothetical protein
VSLLGGYAGLSNPGDPDLRDVDVYETILSGDLAGNDGPDFVNFDENSLHVTTGSDTNATAVIDGFTITSGGEDRYQCSSGGPGLAPGGNACGSGAGLQSEPSGGGMLILDGSPTINHCRFSSNFVLWQTTMGDEHSCVTVGGEGGGIYNDGGSPTFSHCTFELNRAAITGGAIRSLDGRPTVIGCTFEGNVGAGSAISANEVVIVHCTFVSEHSGGGCPIFGGPHQQGGTVTGSSATIVGCAFVGNDLGGCGVAINVDEATITNCVVVANDGSHPFGDDGGGIRTEGTVVNCVVWGNTPHQIEGQSTSVSHSLVQGGWSGAGFGNLDIDPMFIRDPDPGPDGEWGTADDDYGDLRLLPGSPCIDAGHNNAIARLADTDLDGNPRFANDPATADTGCGLPVIVDMGAYEFQGEPADVVFADLTGDGTVGPDDVETLLNCWSSPDEQCCVADLDLDGVVGVVDFLILLGNWG